MTTSQYLESALDGIEPASSEWLARAQHQQNTLIKPPCSLGRLEEIANRICAMQRTLEPCIQNPAIFVFAADHGVCQEGVNPYPQAVTRQMVANFLAGGAAINALAESVGADLFVVDVGVLGPPLVDSKLITRRIGPGTNNFCREAAMSRQQAIAAIAVGMECAESVIHNGSTLLAIGEMGIGNTTVASALCTAITHADPDTVCGRGTGCDDTGLARKRDAVRRALALHGAHIPSPLELLARLGGFEIAAICGTCIAAARNRVAVIVDGFISTAAATLAVAMNPAIRDYLIAGHQSTEPGQRALLQLLKLQPLLDLNMRLGEGTGAALAIPIIRAAVASFRSMATFESAGITGSCAESSA
jgi:nicotinate-nucleotide--dimethylbenzimidazole phosphoribosyltransferase